MLALLGSSFSACSGETQIFHCAVAGENLLDPVAKEITATGIKNKIEFKMLARSL